MACHAAIKGGLSPSISFPLVGVYIQQAERLIDMETIPSLLVQTLLDFTNRVADSIIQPDSESTIHHAEQYVSINTHQSISVSDVATHVSFSHTYLLSRYKKQLSMFIKQCKLGKARDLWVYSTKSKNVISNYLGFSSKSHFYKAFENIWYHPNDLSTISFIIIME